MGARLFPSVLAVLGEPYEDWSMIDRLNRLAQLDLVELPDDWRRFREIRNRLTHEYPDAPEIQAAVLNQAWETTEALRVAYGRIIAGLASRGIGPPDVA